MSILLRIQVIYLLCKFSCLGNNYVIYKTVHVCMENKPQISKKKKKEENLHLVL